MLMDDVYNVSEVRHSLRTGLMALEGVEPDKITAGQICRLSMQYRMLRTAFDDLNNNQNNERYPEYDEDVELLQKAEELLCPRQERKE